jgi:hypothetical protein
VTKDKPRRYGPLPTRETLSPHWTVDRELVFRVRALAEKTGKPQTAIVEEALLAYFDK